MIIVASRIPDINTSTIYEFREKIGVSQISVYLDLKRQFIWRLTDCECENSVDIDSIRLKLAESSSWYNASMCLELPFPNSGRVPTNHIFFRPVITDIFFPGHWGGKQVENKLCTHWHSNFQADTYRQRNAIIWIHLDCISGHLASVGLITTVFTSFPPAFSVWKHQDENNESEPEQKELRRPQRPEPSPKSL